jgi:hypothetical protein
MDGQDPPPNTPSQTPELTNNETTRPSNPPSHQIPQFTIGDYAPPTDGQDPPPNSPSHQTPELTNNEMAAPPNPPSHQIPQFTINDDAPPMDGQDPPPNSPSHQTPELTNNEMATPPNPLSHQIPQFTTTDNAPPTDRQDPLPNSLSHQTPELTNNETTRPSNSLSHQIRQFTMDEQELPPNPQVHQLPDLTNKEIAPPPNPLSHQTAEFANNGNTPPTDGQDLPPNPQSHPKPQATAPHPRIDGISLPNSGQKPQPFIFQGAHQPDEAFRPPNFKTNPFVFRSNVNPPRQEGPSRGQIPGKRRRDSSSQGPISKRQRARSADPQDNRCPSPDISTTSNIPAHIVLQILEVRDKQAREGLLNDIRHLMTDAFRTPGSTGPTSTAALTEDKILEIIRPLFAPQPTSGE